MRGPWPGLPSAVKSPAAQQTLRTWGLPAGPACLILTTGQVPESWPRCSGSPPVLQRPLSTHGKSDPRQRTPGPDARTRPRPARWPPHTLAGLFGVREVAWSPDKQPLKVPLLPGGPRPACLWTGPPRKAALRRGELAQATRTRGPQLPAWSAAA